VTEIERLKMIKFSDFKNVGIVVRAALILLALASRSSTFALDSSDKHLDGINGNSSSIIPAEIEIVGSALQTSISLPEESVNKPDDLVNCSTEITEKSSVYPGAIDIQERFRVMKLLAVQANSNTNLPEQTEILIAKYPALLKEIDAECEENMSQIKLHN
jgi:hypothetical protein